MSRKSINLGSAASGSGNLDPRVPHRITHVARAFNISMSVIERLKRDNQLTIYEFGYDRTADYVMVDEFIAEFRRHFQRINEVQRNG